MEIRMKSINYIIQNGEYSETFLDIIKVLEEYVQELSNSSVYANHSHM